MGPHQHMRHHPPHHPLIPGLNWLILPQAVLGRHFRLPLPSFPSGQPKGAESGGDWGATSRGCAWGLGRRRRCMGGVGTLPEGHMVTPPQRDWPAQVLLLTTVHKDGKFSTTHQPTSHWGLSLCPQEPPASPPLGALSAWLTRHSFKSTPCGCSLGSSAGAVAAGAPRQRSSLSRVVQLSSWDKRPLIGGSCAPCSELSQGRGEGLSGGASSALLSPGNTPKHHSRRQEGAGQCQTLPLFLTLLAQPCLPSHGSRC